MRAMVIRAPDSSSGGKVGGTLLEQADLPRPSPTSRSVVIRVSVCGVCRTDLDLAEGRIVAPRYPVVPGHQVIGTVAEAGEDASEFRAGDRVGVAWIHSTCGQCRECRAGRENLCPHFRATGCHADGGYAEYTSAPADYVHPIPPDLGDAEAAPLLCAGAVGWRALRLSGIRDGDPLGLCGFGASNHLVLQFARFAAPNSPVVVFARSAAEQGFARDLGAQWVGSFDEVPPQRLAAIIDTTPAWRPLVRSLAHLAPGGTLVVNAIRKHDDDRAEVLQLDYARDLWMEREIKSVANVTRADVREALAVAARMKLRPTVTELPLDKANDALTALRRGGAARGATVLRVT